MGHVQRRADKWQARYRDGTGREHTKRFARKADAERWITIHEAAVARGEWVDPLAGKLDFASLADRWLATKADKAPSTQRFYRDILRANVLPTLGSRPIGAIRPSDLDALKAALAEKAPTTIRHALGVAHGVLKLAERDGLISSAPTVERPRPSKRKPERFLTHDEVAVLADTITPRYRAWVYTAAYTGLRFGELAALRVADLNLLRREVTVARSISESGGMVESGPKTNAGRRTLKLPVPIVDLLAAHLVDHRWDLVFPGVEGRPLRGSTFRQRHFDPAVRRSGLGPLTPHDLRHTHASWLIAAGEHPKVIQARLGHSSITVTLDTYGHLMAGLDEGAADKLGASFADSARRPSLAK